MKIINPSKIWWEGDVRVEPFMRNFSKTLDKYYPSPCKERTDIYNRAYEAVYSAIRIHDNEKIVSDLGPLKSE